MIPTLQIKLNGTDVTSYVVSYERNQQICTGTSTCSITFIDTFYSSYSVEPYDVFTVYEDGNKMGTFYASKFDISDNAGTVIIDCQDESKKMSDYFVKDSYLIDYYSYSKYWIEKFLTEADVSYQFDTSEAGSPLSNNTTLGKDTCYNIVLSLVQQSGWHFIADANNVVHIGKLDIDVETHDIILPGEHTILSINRAQNDNILRNRVVVWGSGSEDNYDWVFAESKVYSPYNYDQTDLRTAVLSNGNIYTTWDAKVLADRILKETNHISDVKTVEIAGFVDTIVGESAFLDTRLYDGWGLITSISVRASTEGIITSITLDERCPRIYAYFGYRTNYVYIGTDGCGVWRKPFTVNGWTDYSTGLTDLNVTDLAVNCSTLACVTTDGSLFKRRTIDGGWYKLHPDNFIVTISGDLNTQVIPSGLTFDDITTSGLRYSAADVACMACDINRSTNEIVAVHTLSGMLTVVSGTFMPVISGATFSVTVPIDGYIPEEDWISYSGQYWHSWVTTFANTNNFTTEEVIVNGSNDVYAYDIACDGATIYLSCLAKIPNDPPRRWNEVIREEGWQSLAFPADALTAIVSKSYLMENGIGELDPDLGYNVSLNPDKLPVLRSPQTNFKYSAEITDAGKFNVNIYTVPSSGVYNLYSSSEITVEEYPESTIIFSQSVTPDYYSDVSLTNYGRTTDSKTMNVTVHYKVDWYDPLYYYTKDVYYIFGIVDGTILYNHHAYVYARSLLSLIPEYNWEILEDTKTGDTAFNMVDPLVQFFIVTDKYPIHITNYATGEYESVNSLTLLPMSSHKLKLPSDEDYISGSRAGLWESIALDRDADDRLCYGLLWLNSSEYAEIFAFDPDSGIVRRRYLTGNPYAAGADKVNLSYYEIQTLQYIYKNALYYPSATDASILTPNLVLTPALDYVYEDKREKLVHGVAKRTDQGDYIFLAETPVITHLEASKENPLVAFGGNETMGFGFLQIFPYGYRDNTVNIYTYLQEPDYSSTYWGVVQSPLDMQITTTLSGTIFSPSYIPDVRIFDWLSATEDHRYVGFTKITPSGTEIEGGTEITMSGVGDIYMIDYWDNQANNLLAPQFVNYIMLPVYSGITLLHLETTNYQDIPYVFTSNDSVPPRFFEKESVGVGKLDTGFIEYVQNIPNAKITCIRADDKI